MTLIAALSAALILSTAYALFLALTDFGLWLRQELTWLSVVFGVSLTLTCIALVDPAAAQLAALFFAATGLPIVVESLVRAWRNHRAAQAVQLGERDE